MTLENSFSAASERLAAIDLSDLSVQAVARANRSKQIADKIAELKVRLNEFPALIESARKAGTDTAALARRALGEDIAPRASVADLEAEREDITNTLRGLTQMEEGSETAKRNERDAVGQRMSDAVEPLAAELEAEVKTTAKQLLHYYGRLVALGAATSSGRASQASRQLQDALDALARDRVIERGPIAVDRLLLDTLAGGEAAIRLANRSVPTQVHFPRPSID